ncbi:MAG: 50S ribosomal protein L23 [Nitrospinales bacterium]
MDNHYQIIEKPLITEKSTVMLHEKNRVTFRVRKDANKVQIKRAVEKIFNVKVLGVNIVNVKGKYKRFGREIGLTKSWKKAILQLKEGDKIELFEGM